MTIWVDADGCPVIREIEQTARRYALRVVLLCDTNHVLNSDYSEIRVIGAGADAVDIALSKARVFADGDIQLTDTGMLPQQETVTLYLPDEQLQPLVTAVKAKLAAGDVAELAGKLGGLFGKK